MNVSRVLPILAAVAIALLSPGVASAQGAPGAPGAGGVQPTELGKFNSWTAYSANAKTGKVCYALAQPQSRKPSGLTRDPAYLFISNRPKDNVRNEISLVIGFTVKTESNVQLDIGRTDFKLYTRGDGAWMQSTEDEAALIKAMRTGRDLSVKAVSQRGRTTTDTYSLQGIRPALDAINKDCR